MTAPQGVATHHDRPAIDLPTPEPPGWLTALPGLEAVSAIPLGSEFLELGLASGTGLSRLEVAFSGVRDMDILTFQQAVSEAYRAIFSQVAALPTPHPVRFWALVPNIHEDLGAGLDRYRAFNAGRFAAYSAQCGGREAFGQSVATGSAVGIHGDRLYLHCLASARPGLPVENPRQIPAYRYSRRYGPLPPCFARATALPEGPWGEGLLLVGGTASIRGETSLHEGDVREQTLETLRNLASLVRSAAAQGEADDDEALLSLGCFRELRVYRPRLEDTEAILEVLAPVFTGVERIEVLEAELCRPELLVELEGLARLEAAR